MRIFVVIAIATLLTIGCGERRGAEEIDSSAEASTFAICDVDGTELLTQNDIVAYDTGTHVITLVPGKRDEIASSQSLIGGSSFTIFVNGESQYSGRFTTSLSSLSVDDVVINLFALGLEDDQVKISLGYPSRSCYTADGDPRTNESVIATLKALGKAGG